ncbi:hypothetical protein [Larsenimonas suaedae]|uniref:PepSY domain-containing protein n=1 Tax=Larsenimonas suaedae TaxID=1851019 RepID=A0ABU1GRU4_9GAMM|nr:hypothetical protein [Larsenimonas suaedae]MCM2972458.1 hypothetical protein [Larsenimonas suaedae]MDR5894746.1 hypothetical protein [Larsenimonas suaedae]
MGLPRLMLAASLSTVFFIPNAFAAPHAPSAPVVKQCIEAAHQGAEQTQGLPFEHSNVVRYHEGTPYRLRVSLRGDGNGYYNVTCHVDKKGGVTYQGFELGGQPVE